MDTDRSCNQPLPSGGNFGPLYNSCVDALPTSGDLKYDAGKLRYSLIPPEVTLALAEVLTFGARKYAPNSWQTIPNAPERYLDALIRHLEAHRSGELYDPESNLPHVYHLLCNAAFLTYFTAKDLNARTTTSNSEH